MFILTIIMVLYDKIRLDEVQLDKVRLGEIRIIFNISEVYCEQIATIKNH